MSDHSKERHFYGAVAVGERGQIVIPKEARDDFGIKPGDKLVVLGRGGRGIVLLKADKLRAFAEKILKSL
jgi:AbrB family looped-hinge helix DNA binding protein